MRILVLGAYGLIGAVVVRRLRDEGRHVTGLGRSVASARQRNPDIAWIKADIATLVSSADWLPLLSGIDGVVNCSGALQNSGRDNLKALHSEAMKALVEACALSGVSRFVQISAVGASVRAGTEFLRTKAEGDEALASSSLDHVILRPGLVLAPGAYGGTALLRAMASFPVIQPSVSAAGQIQTVHVDDVAEAVVRALTCTALSRRSFDLVAPGHYSLVEVVAAFRAWLGYPPQPVVTVPGWAVRLVCRVGDGLGWLGWRSPLRTTALIEILAGVTGDPGPWRQATGTSPDGLDAALRRMPATVQERWFARLWLLKPLVIGSLSLFWLTTAFMTVFQFDAATSLLTERGVGAGAAAVAVAAGVAIDIVLGASILFRRWMAPAALGMIAMTAGYLLAGSLVAGDLWLDPLGPYVKTVPGAVLALVALALKDDR